MNREIKFRAWDGNRMRQVWKIIWNDMIGVYHVFFTDTQKNEPGHLSSQDERLVLMQYSGLKDSKGNEIWEGDIRGDYPMKNDVFAVVYHKGAFRIHRPYTPLDRANLLFQSTLDYTVHLGNIYEHPQLLTP
jgi:hypothetical protein